MTLSAFVAIMVFQMLCIAAVQMNLRKMDRCRRQIGEQVVRMNALNQSIGDRLEQAQALIDAHATPAQVVALFTKPYDLRPYEMGANDAAG